MTTRIYQGRIISAKYEDSKFENGERSAIDALVYTFGLLQDATNYHMVALAGMAEEGDATIGMRFKQQIRKIWTEHPRGKAEAKTLQQSVTEILNLRPDASFDEAVAVIYADCERPDMLPYVQQLIMDFTQKGDGAIQQEGRGLLPKLCDINFKGNYPYSSKERKAKEGKLKLIEEFARENITQDELEDLANEMDLSWAGIKTQPNEDSSDAVYYSQEETKEQIKENVEMLCDTLKKKKDAAWSKYAAEYDVDLETEVLRLLENRPVINSAHLLAKNNKAVPELKQAAIFFMYYPSRLSADLLKVKLGKEKTQKQVDVLYDCSALEEDPILLARGGRGYVYRGFTALPEWQQEGGAMYSAEWDILAFKEALKTLHSYELKTQERNEIVSGIEAELNYMMKGEGKAPSSEDEAEGSVPVLGGDPRYELLLELVREISPDEQTDYTISKRALNAYEDVREKWMIAEKAGFANEKTLVEIVRNVQGGSTRFGSGVLFEALCKEKYRPIWHDWTDGGKMPRSTNILRDFGRVQELKKEKEQYRRPIKITAAESVYSPRQLLFSDLKNFGPKRKGHEYVKGQKGVVKLSVAVRDDAGHLEGATVIVRYSAPRFERDQLGTDAANWMPSKKGEDTVLPWLQPMMRALGINEKLLHLEKEPALALQVKPGNICLLNFPVSLDLAPLHEYMGKAAIWKNQMLGGKDEKLHLHWPSTYKAKERPWWKNEHVQHNGFDVLGVDLGVRYAAAWALTHVQRESQLVTANNTVLQGRCIGSAEEESWYGFSRKQGLIKIDGEGSVSMHYASRDASYEGAQLPDGVTCADKTDIELAERILNRAGISKYSTKNVLALGNEAIRAFGRLLSRCRRYQSILVKLKDDEKVDTALLEAREYFDYNEATRQYIPGIIEEIDASNITKVSDMLLGALLQLRAELPQLASDVVNLVVPRKKGCWRWVDDKKAGCICSGRIKLMETGGDAKRHVYHRGGLSMKRLSQLEELRQKLQSLNRILWMEPGVTTPFGSDTRDIPVEDPCPDLLTKIENVREQRVNKIAHDIVAQALGVRLIKSRVDKNTGGKDIIHGEYEVIPGRKPVDFVVLENLSAYRTSIDKTPEENSTLMRWAHRQLVAKVKQLLEDVFGIPVLCTHAAYTSKFDAYTSMPGFRARELDLAYINYLIDSKDDTIREIARIYNAIWQNVPIPERNKGLKLIAPHRDNAGEFFVSPTQEGVRVTNADINAAINIAWRGIAAPDAFDLLHRVRLEKKKNKLTPRDGNLREKALKGVYSLKQNGEFNEGDVNVAGFWVDKIKEHVPSMAYYESNDGVRHHLAYGKQLWGYMKNWRWLACHIFNYRVLCNLTDSAEELKKFIMKSASGLNDDIPM